MDGKQHRIGVVHGESDSTPRTAWQRSGDAHQSGLQRDRIPIPADVSSSDACARLLFSCRSGTMNAKPPRIQDQGYGPVALCVLRLERQKEELLITVSINPDIRIRAAGRSFRALDLERALDAIRDTAAQLMAAKPFGD